MPTTKTEHQNLHEALRAVQGTVGALPKTAVNPHFRSKFTPLEKIVEIVGPVLVEHGLTWQTFPCYGPDTGPALRYRLTHAATGEFVEEVMPLLLTKADPQGFGSAITYARRYSLSSVLNLVSDEDEDGEAASKPAKPAEAKQPGKARSLTVKTEQTANGQEDWRQALLDHFTAAGAADQFDAFWEKEKGASEERLKELLIIAEAKAKLGAKEEK